MSQLLLFVRCALLLTGLALSVGARAESPAAPLELERSGWRFDALAGELRAAGGELLLAAPPGAPRAAARALRGALAKWRAVAALADWARGRELRSRGARGAAGPFGPRLCPGQRTGARFEGQRGEYLLLFNLAGDGRLQLIYPLPGDPRRHGWAPWVLPTVAAAPAGADHLVALVYATPQPTLIDWLRARDGRRAAAELAAALRAAPPLQVGLYAFLSAAPGSPGCPLRAAAASGSAVKNYTR